MLLESPVAHPISTNEAEKLAREFYRIKADARKLPGEYDDNFHLRSGDAREFVLKVMHPARERSFIDMQCRALTHLAARLPEIRLPRVVPTQEATLFTEVAAADGTRRLVWLLSFVPGKVLAEIRPHSDELLDQLGGTLGAIDLALQEFKHPAAHRELKWDLAAAGWIRKHIDEIPEGQNRALVQKFLSLYEAQVVPALPQLRRGVIYGDANDHNVIVHAIDAAGAATISLIDFGDMHYGVTVSEAAIAAAYAVLGKKDVLKAAAAVIAGYHRKFALQDCEIAAIFPLMAMRLAVSVTNSTLRKSVKPGDAYVTVTEDAAWVALQRLAAIHPRFAQCTFRQCCGLTPVPQWEPVLRWIGANAGSAASLFEQDLRIAKTVAFDLSAGSDFLGADPRRSETKSLTQKIFSRMDEEAAAFGIGRYNEARLVYTTPLFGSRDNPLEERRTIHLGIDFFAKPGTAIHAPLDARVHCIADNEAQLDYGPLVILKHEAGDAGQFFTLYGHLKSEVLGQLRVGQPVAQGENFASIGDVAENGGWPPHLHFQVILDLLELDENFPGVALASQRATWTSLSPDPNLLLRISQDRFPPAEPPAEEALRTRRQLLGGNLSVSYAKPLKIVRGWMQHLYDDTGRAYLDFYNNVPLVGHSHPRVVQAAQRQLGLLNTNTRYLHDTIHRCAERLLAHLPEPLRVCYFVNSGSEANELALRLARAHTGHEDVIVLEHAYHGNTSALIDLSPYKFDGPGGRGRKPWVHVAPLADDYRGRYRRDDPQAGEKYANHVRELTDGVRKEGRGVAALVAETLPSVAGQIVFPPGYLASAFGFVRRVGGVCIADEVQAGFGRLGTHFWGFETQDAIPDIVVLGKPIGNGFPLGAVITSREIAESFANGMEFFSTFGGNPVACAAGLATLQVVEEENLQAQAMRIGSGLRSRLERLAARFAVIGDVRGAGLFLGLDLVLDRKTREPATRQASYVVNRLREYGILTGTDGPYHNVIKLRPPLIITEGDAGLFVEALEVVLGEDAAQPHSI